MTTTATVTFERIGRVRDVAPLTVTTPIPETLPDLLAEEVHRHARRYLGSSNYGVTVDLEAGRVSVEGGRFGSGTVTVTETCRLCAGNCCEERCPPPCEMNPSTAGPNAHRQCRGCGGTGVQR